MTMLKTYGKNLTTKLEYYPELDVLFQSKQQYKFIKP